MKKITEVFQRQEAPDTKFYFSGHEKLHLCTESGSCKNQKLPMKHGVCKAVNLGSRNPWMDWD